MATVAIVVLLNRTSWPVAAVSRSLEQVDIAWWGSYESVFIARQHPKEDTSDA